MKHLPYQHLAVLCSLLFFLSSCGQNASSPPLEDDDVMVENLEYRPAKVIGPTTEFTLENQIAGVTQSYDNVCDSYAKMQELSGAEDAPLKGKKAAAKVEKKYANRIAELADSDFTQMTSEELLSLSVELTDMISAIREARDALTQK